MISNTYDTTAPGTEAATEDDETRDNRERHVAIIDGLQEMADYLADAGPTAGLVDWQSSGRISLCISRHEAPVEDRLARLTAIAGTLGVEVDSISQVSGSIHYHVFRSFGPIQYDAFTIVDPDEISDAGAALAEAITAAGGAR